MMKGDSSDPPADCAGCLQGARAGVRERGPAVPPYLYCYCTCNLPKKHQRPPDYLRRAAVTSLISFGPTSKSYT